MKPVILSPLPPVKSGIADYVHEQLPVWSDLGGATVVVDQPIAEIPAVPDNVEILHIADWRRQQGSLTAPHLFHVGNNPHHEFVYKAAFERRGVVVLHDVNLHHLVTEMTLARGDEAGYRMAMERNWGDIGASAADLRASGVFTEFEQFLMPLNREIIEAADALVVHSDWARRQAHQIRDLTVYTIPHHVLEDSLHVPDSERLAARDRLGMPQDKLIFLSAGHVTPPKKIDQVVRALGELRDDIPDFEFWIVGEAKDPAELDAEIAAAGLEAHTTITDYASMDTFLDAFRGADVVLNLRYPTAGESSGTLARALGMGRCCVVYNYAAFGDFPSHVAVKIPLNADDHSRLRDALKRLANSPEERRNRETSAARYMAETATLRQCVSRYQACLRELYGQPADVRG